MVMQIYLLCLLGEFIDLESLCKKPNENLHEIMAVLYRPIEHIDLIS